MCAGSSMRSTGRKMNRRIFLMRKIIGVFGFTALIFFTTHLCAADPSQQDRYEAVPGLIDLRSTLSDGVHTVEDLVQMARSRGFKLLELPGTNVRHQEIRSHQCQHASISPGPLSVQELYRFCRYLRGQHYGNRSGKRMGQGLK